MGRFFALIVIAITLHCSAGCESLSEELATALPADQVREKVGAVVDGADESIKTGSPVPVTTSLVQLGGYLLAGLTVAGFAAARRELAKFKTPWDGRTERRDRKPWTGNDRRRRADESSTPPTAPPPVSSLSRSLSIGGAL